MHALTTGAVGMMTLAVMTRARLLSPSLDERGQGLQLLILRDDPFLCHSNSVS